MSTPEHNGEAEGRSSVKLTRNAKGETQIEVKAYVGDTSEQIDVARAKAVEVYNGLCGIYPVRP